MSIMIEENAVHLERVTITKEEALKFWPEKVENK